MPTEEKIEELKALIAKKLGSEFSLDKLNNEYGLLDHVDGKCDYDPYDR